MKKKIVLIICIVFVLATVVYSVCTKGIFSNHIYFPQNVYEEIWNLLIAEEQGKTTLLTTAVEEAKENWVEDKWGGRHFASVQYPDSQKTLGWRSSDEIPRMLIFKFYPGYPKNLDSFEFGYDYKTNTLYGTRDESWFREYFLNEYFQWCEESADFSSKYSPDNLGDYHYQKVELLFDVLYPDGP